MTNVYMWPYVASNRCHSTGGAINIQPCREYGDDKTPTITIVLTIRDGTTARMVKHGGSCSSAACVDIRADQSVLSAPHRLFDHATSMRAARRNQLMFVTLLLIDMPRPS